MRLMRPLRVAMHAVLGGGKVGHGDSGGDGFTGFQRQDIDHRDAAPGAIGIGDLVGFFGVDLAPVGEEQDGIQGAGGDEEQDLVFSLVVCPVTPRPPRLCRRKALATTRLI